MLDLVRNPEERFSRDAGQLIWHILCSWSYLTVTTNGQGYSDSDQAYAAGLVEGFLTRELIGYHWYNTIHGQFCDEPMPPKCVKMKNFLQTNLDWMRKQIELWKNDSYWHMVGPLYINMTMQYTFTGDNMSRVVRKTVFCIFAYAKTKMQISFAVTAKLISAFVFATWIVVTSITS